MTTLSRRMRQCHHCRKVSEQTEIGSSNSFGACDLDTRPAEMVRGTMPYWVQECPHCGYVGSRLTDRTSSPPELIESEGYRTCDGIAFQSGLAKRFYRLYLIKRSEKDAENAFWSALEAAWASDDAGDAGPARECRKLALPQLEILIKKNRDEVNFEILKLDLLRRVGDFDGVVQLHRTIRTKEKFLARVAAYEVELARKKDDACHSVAEIAPPD